MTGETLATQFENLIDDTHDETHTYQLLTQAKNKLEWALNLYVLQDIDETQTKSSGDTWETLKSVSSNFRKMIKLYVDNYEYFPVPFANARNYRNMPRRYYINHKRQVAGSTCLGLTGSGSSGTIRQIFLSKTTDLTAANKTTDGIILWPGEFQPILPYLAAEIFQANIDPDDISVRQALAQRKEAAELLDMMVAWDHDLKLGAMGNALGYADADEPPFDVGLL